MPDQQTLDLPKRLPLFVEPENRDETTSKDARLINCYVERKGQNMADLYQRVGLTQYSQPSGGSATGRGIFQWRGSVYSVVGATFYKDGVSKGTVDATNGVYRFDSCLGATPKLFFGNGVKAYTYDDSGGLVTVTDVDFPSSFVKGMGYLDATSYVMTPAAVIQGSGLNDPTSWDPLNFLTAQIEPDQGMALAKQLVYILGLKQWTTEVFYDAANATGSPLGTVQGGKMNYGCASADSVQRIGDVLYWLAVSQEGGMQVVMVDNLKLDPVSTKPIERLLDNWDLTTIYSWQLKHDGHGFYGLTSVTSNMTLVYDTKEKLWSQWTDKNGNYWPIVGSTYTSTYGHLLQHESNGKIYTANSTATTDDGDQIQVDVYTPNLDAGTTRGKYLPGIFFDTDQVAGAILQVRCNDYDYDATRWTNFRQVDLGLETPALFDNGTFQRRAYNLRYANKALRMPRLKAVDLQMELCTL